MPSNNIDYLTNTDIQPELLFLIAKFLSRSPFRKSANHLIQELEQHNVSLRKKKN
jgi:hypothetical protein